MPEQKSNTCAFSVRHITAFSCLETAKSPTKSTKMWETKYITRTLVYSMRTETGRWRSITLFNFSWECAGQSIQMCHPVPVATTAAFSKQAKSIRNRQRINYILIHQYQKCNIYSLCVKHYHVLRTQGMVLVTSTALVVLMEDTQVVWHITVSSTKKREREKVIQEHRGKPSQSD